MLAGSETELMEKASGSKGERVYWSKAKGPCPK